MPNRIIRDGILSSDRVNSLSQGAEVFYRRLMSVVDDYGRFDGRLQCIRAACYPLMLDKVTDNAVQKWLQEVMKAGLVKGYIADGKPFILFVDFRQHIRAVKSKCPDPVDFVEDAAQLQCIRSASAHVGVGGDGVEGDILSKRAAALEIYDAYPRREGKQKAIQSIIKQFKNSEPAHILERTSLYAKCVARWPKDQARFIPLPATWFNQGRYDDDPIFWERAQTQANGKPSEKSLLEKMAEEI